MPIQNLQDTSKHTGYIELQEIVICAAAINSNDNMIIPSKRHCDELFWKVCDRIYQGQHEIWKQGFLTSSGRVVDRKVAWKIAEAANQIRRVTGSPGTLYSEDLY